MDTPIAFILTMLVIGVLTWTIVFKGATGAENVRYLISVVVIAVVVGYGLSLA